MESMDSEFSKAANEKAIAKIKEKYGDQAIKDIKYFDNVRQSHLAFLLTVPFVFVLSKAAIDNRKKR